MLAASCFSYYLVERPLRKLDWAALGRRLRTPAPSLAAGALALTAVLVVGATVGQARAGSAVVSLASVTPPVAGSSDGPRPGADLPPPSRANPYRVWIFGDSVMADGAPGVVAALQATGEVSVAINSSFPGWGLTRDQNWPADAAPAISQQRPQIAIGTWSWDDQAALADPAGYRARLEADIRTLLAPPDNLQLVVLLQFPQAGPNLALLSSTRQSAWVQQNRDQEAWNAAARQAAAAFPGRAVYLTTSDLFAPGGRFLTWFKTPTGGWLRARKLDNAHFCPYGSAALSGLVAADLRSMLGVAAPAPGWEFGAWTRASRYNDPPGACPNDRPPPGYRGVPVPTSSATR
jgi:hypothetical protein